MGLPEDHPLKEGELIDLDKLVEEVKARLARKEQLDKIAAQAEGLRVVDGIKGEVKKEEVKPKVDDRKAEPKERVEEGEVKVVSALAAQAAE